MPAGDFRTELKGLVEFQRGLRSMQQPELKNTVQRSMSDAARTILVPAIKSKAPRGPAPHTSAAKGKRGREGPLSRNVTVKQARKRDARVNNEMVSMNTGPRAWYRHFVIQGTQPHSLAKGASVRKGLRQNVGRQHPGSQDNNFVEEAVTGKNTELARATGDALIRRFKQAIGKP